MLDKKANGPHYWPQVLNKVKSIGLRPEISTMLNNVNQIVWDQSPPADNPNAIAYVSSEDKDDDGKIDKIHFVLSKFPPNAEEGEINSIVEMVARTLVHEYGHMEDFDPEKGFPGGEGVAESAERQSESTIQSGLTTLSALNNFKGKGLNMLKELQKLANHLDGLGEVEFADRLDSIVASNIKLAAMPTRQSVREGVDLSQEEIAALDIWDAVFKEAYNTYSPAYAIETSPLKAYLDSGIHVSKVWNDPQFNSISEGTAFKTTISQTIPNFESLISGALVKINPQDQPQAKATRTHSNLMKIQDLVGSTADGIWGPNTKAAVETFLGRNSKHLIPEGQAGVNQAINGWWTTGVAGVSAAGKYEKSWLGLLNLLTDLEGKGQDAMMTDQDASRAPDSAYQTPRVEAPAAPATEAPKAEAPGIGAISSEFSVGIPKFSR